MLKWDDPRAIDETIEQVRAKVRKLTRTGGGREHSFEFKNLDGTKFMTEEEIKEMESHILLEYTPKFIYRNERRISLPETRLRFKEKTNTPEILQKTMDQFIRYCLGKADGDLKKTKMSFGFYHEGFNKTTGFWINERTYESFNGQILFEELGRIIQSKQEISIDDTFKINLHVFNDLNGGARAKFDLFDEQLKISAFVVGNGKCLPKAVAIGIAFLESTESEEKKDTWKKLTNSCYRYKHETLQTQAADKILFQAGLPTTQQFFDLQDLEKIAQVFPQYKFEVYMRASYEKFYEIIKELNPEGGKIISIAFKKDNGVGHYDFIKMSLIYMKAVFCHKCKEKTSSKGHYQVCKARCSKCGLLECDTTQNEIHYCDKCNTNFSNKECYENHLKCAYNALKPMCEKRYTCEFCNLRIFKDRVSQDEVHQCEKKVRCRTCMQMFDKTRHHNCCFEPPRKRLKETKMIQQHQYKILCYDVESIVVNSANGPDFTKPQSPHKVNLICYKMFCNKCTEGKEEGEEEECECETGHFGYTNCDTPLEDFVEFLLFNKKVNGSYILAHNGGRYDHNFVLSKMISIYGIIPEYISNGTALIKATIKPIRKGSRTHNRLEFRDSVLYIPMALSKIPKTFGILEMKKGFYPYYFNHEGNYGKVFLGLPSKHFYDPNHMKCETLEEFEKWYEEHANDVFEADKELLTYCQSDVEILSAGLIQYIKICKQLFNGWNPILSSSTIASFVHHIMKFEHFKPGDLGIVEENGYPERTNSVLALKMLLWIEKKSGISIDHKLRGPEKKIEMANGDCYFVDGFEKTTNTVFEIHGCFFHGCPKCTNPTLEHPNHPGVENKAIYDRTIRRQEKIREVGYNLIVFWEHDIVEMLKNDQQMREFFKLCRHATHLLPREGMFGGRTQPYQMIVECEKDEELQYDDFNSLYPSVNIQFEYPRGQPIPLKRNLPKITPGQLLSKKGVYLCSVLAPPDIDITVLPYRTRGKLTFPSCKTCIEAKLQTICFHTKVSERYFTGVWTHVELNEAIKRGYQILQLHEIWWWPDDCWKTADYFLDYLKPMIKLKHESSGWPKEDMTDVEKTEFVKEIEQRDGVTLDPTKIEKADAMRAMSKLYLNVCWGKFSENPIKMESKIFDTLDHVSQSKFMSEQGFDVKGILDWDNGRTIITRSGLTESVKTKPFTNIVIGIYTTAYARVRLLKAMEAVGSKNLIYVDTDSVVYKKKIDDPNPLAQLRGEGLGKLKSEIPNGYRMDKIVCMAPKVYMYRLENKETKELKYVTKFKGVSMNSATNQIINMDAMESSVKQFLKDQKNHISTIETTMRRSKVLGDISTVSFDKQLQPVMDKVMVLPDGKTKPSGYYPNCPLVNDYPY